MEKPHGKRPLIILIAACSAPGLVHTSASGQLLRQVFTLLKVPVPARFLANKLKDKAQLISQPMPPAA